jgi:2-polyprenyl-6-methoxyphenol hydroxylase-like FAD-dependent oxidoreductase
MNDLSTAASQLSIIIIGAGIGGLTLANVLHQFHPKINVHLFERDSVAHAHTQGGTLGLKKPGGLDALQRLGMEEAIRAVSQPVTQFTILTQQGKHLLTLRGQPHSLRVPRAALRDLLLRDVHHLITFDACCTGYTECQGKPVVQFADGRMDSADIVVDCSGVKSVIRRQLIGDRPHYLGISSISGGMRTTDQHPWLTDGPVLVIGEGVSLILEQQQLALGWSATLRTCQKEWERLSSSGLQELVKTSIRHWSASLREIIDATPTDLITSLGGFYDREPLQHARTGTLVLLGDAAHPMSPFRGEGANMAMLDALSLVGVLQTARERQLIHILARYEQEMLVRTRKAVLQSRRAAKEIHSPNPVTQALLRGKLRLANRFLSRHQEAKQNE